MSGRKEMTGIYCDCPVRNMREVKGSHALVEDDKTLLPLVYIMKSPPI